MKENIKFVYKDSKDFLKCHDITEENRTKLLDWMIQVFRVLKVSTPETFFLASTLLDLYLECK